MINLTLSALQSIGKTILFRTKIQFVG